MMANNRMYLKCGVCGEEKYIDKFYPEFHYDFDSIAEKVEQWNAWLVEHSHGLENTMCGPTHFSISYDHENAVCDPIEPRTTFTNG